MRRRRSFIAALVLALAALTLPPAALARPGDPDGSFGTNGVLYISDPAGGSAGASAALLLADGSLVAAGLGSIDANRDAGIGMLELDPKGQQVTDFGGTGFPAFAAGESSIAESMIRLADGSYLIAGDSFASQSSSVEIALVAVNPDGTLKQGFGAGGIALRQFGRGSFIAGLTDDPGGTAFALVEVSDGFALHLQVLRVLPNGDLDPSFGALGRAATPLTTEFFSYPFFRNGSFARAGRRLYAAGPVPSPFVRQAIGVYALGLNGTPVRSFGRRGLATVDIPGRSAFVTKVLPLPGNRLAVVGTLRDPENGTHPFVLRLDQRGRPDAAFGNRGLLVIEGLGETFVNAAAVGPNGTVLLAGADDDALVLLRVDAGGGLDPSFGSGGIVRTVVSPNLDVSVGALIVGTDSITVAGSLDFNNWLFARYLTS